MADRYVVISSDGHCGADIGGYRPYLESRWHDEFDRWAASFDNPFGRQLLTADPDRNWDSAVRREALEADGIAAEVLFPNTVPPFFPNTAFFTPPPLRSHLEYEQRWAGLRAHNRWLVDFCADLPGRRAGIAQIMLNDVDDACAEARWARQAGLTGGVLLPAVEPGSDLAPIYDPVYDRLWATCEDLGVPLNHHGGTGIPAYDRSPAGRALMLCEARTFGHRTLWHLIFGGVFDRFPALRFVMTEQGAGWVPASLDAYDSQFRRMHATGSGEHFFGGEAVEAMTMAPSGYFARNVWVGASFLHRKEAELRDAIGVDRILWGSDYPHVEGTYPYSRQAIRLALSGVPRHEVEAMLAGNAAAVYGFDLVLLSGVANRIGPLVDEIALPLDPADVPAGTHCSVFDPQRAANQL